MARAKLTVNKVSLSGITRERVMLRMEATIKASRVMLWTETTIERKQGWTIMKILQRIVECLMSIGDSQLTFVQKRGTTGFVVWQMQEKCLAVNKHIYIAFLTLEKAFNVSLEYLSGGSCESYVTQWVNTNARSHVCVVYSYTQDFMI